jgi:hypothetical protein
MKRLSAALCLLLLATPAWAQPTVKLPREVAAKPGRLVRLEAESTGKVIRWILASDDADLIPFPDGKIAIFSSPTPGRYRVYAYTAAGDSPSEPAVCLITVGTPGPTPPPGPGPNPPGPVPPPPVPDDPLFKALRTAWDKEKGAERVKHLSALAGLYRVAPKTAEDPQVKTAGELSRMLRDAADKLLPREALPEIRAAVSGHLRGVLPTKPDASLTDGVREMAAREFKRLGELLGALK